MLRTIFFGAIALTVFAELGACTQDFDQFTPNHGDGSGGIGGATGSTASSSSGNMPTTTSTMTSTTSGSVGGEDCLNGQDDNQDGAVDCADANCTGVSCVDVPESWQGPGILYVGQPGSMPSCPDDFPTPLALGGTGVVAPTACSACSCGAPDITCSPATITAFRNSATCGGGGTPFPQPSPGDCSPLFLGFRPQSYRADPPTATATGCEPSQAIPEGPPPSFSAQGQICALREGSGGCSNGESCAPTQISLPFEGALCIWKDGEQDCPPEFDERQIFATEIRDDRSCSACECDPPEVSCSATTTIFTNGACTTPSQVVANDGACAVNARSGSMLSVEVTSTGGCAARGGEPFGSAEPSGDQTTVCCQR